MSTEAFNMKNATKDQLEDWLKDLRMQRKKGYEAPSKKASKKKSTNPFSDLDPEIAEKVLRDMMKGDGGTK